MMKKTTKSGVKVQDLAKKKAPLSAKETRAVVGGGGNIIGSFGSEFAGGNSIGSIGDEFAGKVTPTIVKGKR
jgi:tryptophan synthase beta subunit